jgi:hypothetical protein
MSDQTLIFLDKIMSLTIRMDDGDLVGGTAAAAPWTGTTGR